MQMPAIERLKWLRHTKMRPPTIYEAFAAVAQQHRFVFVGNKASKTTVSMDKQGAIDLEQWPLAQELVDYVKVIHNDV